MNIKWHRVVIEALGMRATKPRILNKLNEVFAHSDDPKLRKFAEVLSKEILAANSNTEAVSPKELCNGVPTAKDALEYCKSIAYRD